MTITSRVSHGSRAARRDRRPEGGHDHLRWENIYCAEVENVPAVPAVPAALDDLAGRAAGKLASGKLASGQQPAGLVVLGELPRNAAGKVFKHELRARYGDSPQNGGSSE